MDAARRLRELLNAPGVLVAPGCYDTLSAKLLERAGFPIGYVGGFGAAASRLGAPDTGLLSFKEMLDHAAAIAAAVEVPVIADADTGYGNEVNVRRTVVAYGRAGLAGIQLEDQVWPKRCGHADVRAVVEREEAVARIEAAVDARDESGSDIVIVARTDARQALGLEEALVRCQDFETAGADVIFCEALASRDEMIEVAAVCCGPLLANMIEGGKTPLLEPKELEELGYRIVIYPLTLLRVAIAALEAHLAKGGEAGRFAPFEGEPTFEMLQRIVGFDEYDEMLRRYR